MSFRGLQVPTNFHDFLFGHWLNDLMSTRQFGLIGAPLIALVVGAWLVTGIVKDRRRIKRGEPFNVWYLRDPV